ncbi:hypothetical protein [Streptomyces olindensis]|uniref:hypothetical protein n=1 Tax=Streptomyces olindensis TaxID=358823 RepID=UPI003653204C
MNTPESRQTMPPTPTGTHRFTLHGHGRSGSRTFFAYHVSLFNAPPHAYQMVLRIQLSDYVQNIYLNELNNPPCIPWGFRLYHSLNTEPTAEFPLSDLFNGYRTSFVAYIERVFYDTTNGNRDFQKMYDEGRPLPVQVNILSASYPHPIGTDRYSSEFSGLLFGSDEETFLAHRLLEAPDWDEVRAITHTPNQLLQGTLDDFPQITVHGVRDYMQDAYPPTSRYEEKSPFIEDHPYDSTVTRRRDGHKFQLSFSACEQQWWNSTTLNDKN